MPEALWVRVRKITERKSKEIFVRAFSQMEAEGKTELFFRYAVWDTPPLGPIEVGSEDEELKSRGKRITKIAKRLIKDYLNGAD